MFLFLGFLLSAAAFAQSPYTDSIVRHRADYRAKFLSDPNSPLKTKKAVSKLRFFAPDTAFRVTATVTRITDAEPFEMPTFDGKSSAYVRYATLSFTLDGQPRQLTIYRSLRLAQMPMYRDYLFLPFKDTTNGAETYGGGRYLDLRLNDIRDGKLIIDFNKAYNPYCAYSGGYTCPIPPKENHLTVAVRAGEAMYNGK